MIPPRDAWIIRRLLARVSQDGEVDELSPAWREIGAMLQPLSSKRRQDVWGGFLVGRQDADALRKALMEVDPMAEPPDPNLREAAATLADIRAAVSATRWIWDGWLPDARICGLAGVERVGKTRLAMDLAARIWFEREFPDKQPPTFPARTPTIWVCADGQQQDLMETVTAFGLPDEAVIFNTPRSDPWGGTSIDEAEDLETLEAYVQQYRPGLVFVDSLTQATKYDLCSAKEVTTMTAPLKRICQVNRITILLLLHLALSGQALGRRIRGVTRTILQLEEVEEGLLRLFMEATIGKKPEPLGVRMTDDGIIYLENPEEPAGKGKGKGKRSGRPAKQREGAEQFLRDRLATGDWMWNDLWAEWRSEGGSWHTLSRAFDDLTAAGEVSDNGGGPGMGKPLILHLGQTWPENA